MPSITRHVCDVYGCNVTVALLARYRASCNYLGSKIGATLSEDYFAEFRHLLQRGKTYVLENFLVVRSIGEWRGDAYSQSQFSQGSQGSSLGRFLRNAKVVRLGEIKPLTQEGVKNMNSFPTCVNELIGKQLALRFKYRLQYR
ncbi:hypothetical protein JHK82_042943 [Glycine max]|nr:hypothetical protein JHK82_042943 [Glycine max]